MKDHKDYLNELREKLSQLTESELINYITTDILNITPEQKTTAEFVFWFCNTVEKHLKSVLEEGMKMVNTLLGTPAPEQRQFIVDQYGVKLEKIDTTHPNYNPRDISFGDMIYVVEQMRGKTPHVKFLWKVKKIRDDLSHGRINELKYEGESLEKKEVKMRLIEDNIRFAIQIEDEETGGIIKNLDLTDEDKEYLEKLHRQYYEKNPLS